jgi:opacity protein-like surface antigen
MRKLLFAALAAATLAGAAGAASAQPVVVERYGHWDSAWGVAPPPPRAAWRRWRGHEHEWYGHVHTCMVHPGYDARRDMWRDGHRWVACVD